MPSIRINPEKLAIFLLQAASQYEQEHKDSPATTCREYAHAIGHATHFTLDGDVLVAHY